MAKCCHPLRGGGGGLSRIPSVSDHLPLSMTIEFQLSSITATGTSNPSCVGKAMPKWDNYVTKVKYRDILASKLNDMTPHYILMITLTSREYRST